MSGSGEMDENMTADPTLEPPYTDVEPWLRGVHSTVATLLMIASILGNGLILWVVVKNKELHYRSIVASMGAVTINIIFSLVSNSQVLSGSITGEWPFTHYGCVAIGFLSASMFYVRWMNTCLIAVDRFLYITTPFFYQRYSKRILITLSVAVWVLPFLANAQSVVKGNYTYRTTLTLCAIDCTMNQTCSHIYTVVFTVFLIVGVIIPTTIYIFLYCFGKKKRRDMHRELGTHTHDPDSPPWASSNGQVLSGERCFAARRPSTDLVSIDEGDEEAVLREMAADHSLPPSHQTSLEMTQDLETVHEHKILDTARPRNGCTHLHVSTSLQLHSHNVVSLEAGAEDTPTPPEDQIGGESRSKDVQSTEEEGSEGNGIPPVRRKSSGDSGSDSIHSPSHLHTNRRRTSVMRAAMSVIMPGRQRMAVQLRERQAMITFVIIFTNLVVTQIPIYILATTRRQPFSRHIPIWVHLIAVNLYLLAPALEPFIIARNRDFKEALSKMFHRRTFFSPTSNT
jgi:hypothetical protein